MLANLHTQFPTSKSNLGSQSHSDEEDDDDEEYSDVAEAEILTPKLNPIVRVVVPDVTQSSSAILQAENNKLKFEYQDWI